MLGMYQRYVRAAVTGDKARPGLEGGLPTPGRRKGGDMPRRIAVVNDDQVFLELMEVILREEAGYEVLLLRETTGAFPTLEAWRPDGIVLDLLMERPDAGW